MLLPPEDHKDYVGNGVPGNLVIDTRNPPKIPFSEESIEFHAARILLLLKYVGGRKSKIVGRTKLAKLDFFARYPVYLNKAASIRNFEIHSKTIVRPESPMIRYRYGPWDKKYYNIFALLISKGLIEIKSSKDGDVFELTKRGNYAVSEMQGAEFAPLIERCQLISDIFGGETGSGIKKFIYENFPEIVSLKLGEEINKL
ncbi:MAG TPA: hypothetical protein PKD23_01850 [Bellilinea sp.]|nr:hypothetical protein [Bellilinea sp.]